MVLQSNECTGYVTSVYRSVHLTVRDHISMRDQSLAVSALSVPVGEEVEASFVHPVLAI